MNTLPYLPRGRYYEDFKIGDAVVSAGRTITEADIVNFAGVAGDYTQIHLNAETRPAGPIRPAGRARHAGAVRRDRPAGAAPVY